MESNKRTLTINPDLFKLNGGKRNKNQTKQKKFQPSIEEKEVKNINKTKKELLKKVKDYQKNKEIEQIKNQVQLLEDIFEEYNRHYENRLSVCDDIFFSIKYYYDYVLYKFGLCDCKKQ